MASIVRFPIFPITSSVPTDGKVVAVPFETNGVAVPFETDGKVVTDPLASTGKVVALP
jgi:hypothetical protein